MASALKTARANALKALTPPPRLSLADWIENELVLPSEVSALPGRVRLWPYQKGIADAISDPEIERVTIVKPVRVGFTTLLTGALGSFVANEPSPILALLPTEADCRDYVVSDIEPTFEATPALRGLLDAEADPTGRNTLLARRFPGGSLKVVAAKSPRNLRRHTTRILLIDEADAMESTAEGDPVTLAERRTMSFANRKIIVGSTPTFEETSHVLRLYGQSDACVFEIPCPHCGAFFELQWSHIEWEPDRPETAHARCPHCESAIDERFKAQAVAAGAWRATRPDVSGHAGFRLNALVSTLANASWAKLAAEFLAAKDRPDQLQTFVNTILAQGWRDVETELDESELAARAEPFGLTAIPPDVLFLTAGVDVQDDRLETVVLGHGREAIFILDHHVVWGAVHEDTTWAELDDYLKGSWRHPAGGILKIDAAAIDSGSGLHTDRVYEFARARFARRVVAIKGRAGPHPAIEKSTSRKARLFLVGVDTVKGEILSRLSRGRSIRFSETLTPDFFEQLTSERRVRRYSRGRPVVRFERIPGRRAEALDGAVYALAVRSLVQSSPDRRAAELADTPPAKKAGAVVRSAWLAR